MMKMAQISAIILKLFVKGAKKYHLYIADHRAEARWQIVCTKKYHHGVNNFKFGCV
jgi:hypothetical protein